MDKKTNTHYHNNISYLSSMIGYRIVRAIQLNYYYNGTLHDESMGELKLVLDNNRSYIFTCHNDAESLNIEKGDFPDKTGLEKEMPELKWIPVELQNQSHLYESGIIRKIKVEWIRFEKDYLIQSGCMLEFETNQFFYIWTIESDNIFYGLNQKPPYLYDKGKEFDIIYEDLSPF